MSSQVEFEVESLSASRVPEKLARAGISVLRAQPLRKNAVLVRIARKDRKKGFAILESSCYNIKNVRYFGAEALKRRLVPAAGILLGALFFLAVVLFAQTRVLEIRVTGSGAYYEREIGAILSEEGVVRFSPMPERTGGIAAKVLALPRVEFCTLSRKGGVLTVDVQCAGDLAPLAGAELFCPSDGVVEELFVVRGVPLVSEGEEVRAGQAAVSCEEGLVIARIKLRRPVREVFGGDERGALYEAYLAYGELSEIHTEKTEGGWLVEGISHPSASVNLD